MAENKTVADVTCYTTDREIESWFAWPSAALAVSALKSRRDFLKEKQRSINRESVVIQRILLELQAINEDLGAGQRYDAQAKVERLIESLTKQGER